MLLGIRYTLWNYVFYLIMLVQLCAPWFFGGEDGNPDPANEVGEGGCAHSAAAFSYRFDVLLSVLWSDIPPDIR
jgi:hypothetical protein